MNRYADGGFDYDVAEIQRNTDCKRPVVINYCV